MCERLGPQSESERADIGAAVYAIGCAHCTSMSLMKNNRKARTRRPRLFVGICGGSASGKSGLAAYLKRALRNRAVILSLDWYYKDRGGLGETAALKINFDHPSAIEISLLLRQLKMLAEGKTIEAPIYEYRTHSRSPERRIIEPAPLVILEGLFVLHYCRLAELLDLSVFIEAPADLRLMRRLRRDFGERRVEIDETLRLYEKYVRPMHEKFIAPTAERATWRWLQMEDRRFPERLLAEIRSRLRGSL